MAVYSTLAALPEAFGFRNGDRGVHSSRSMMFTDLEQLLGAASASWGDLEYREHLDGENILGKRTATNRDHTARKLRALYGLAPEVTVFRLLKHFWEVDDSAGRPILALLCATARDPLLRSLTPGLLATEHGAALEYEPLEAELKETTGDRFSQSTLVSIVRRVASTWLQSGHLEPRTRIRRRPVVTPAATAYALALGYLEGRRGTFLFDSLWARLLDTPLEELRELAQTASLNGWLVYRGAGDVIEVRFPDLWTAEERDLLDDQA